MPARAVQLGFTGSVLRGLRYGLDRFLEDDTGHTWCRVSDWVEPADAKCLIGGGTRFVVQRCGDRPELGRKERFKREVGARMMTRVAAEAAAAGSEVPTIMVGELWRSAEVGDLLVFVEQGPTSRDIGELQDDW